MEHYITTFYKFIKFTEEDVLRFDQDTSTYCNDNQILGLIILGTEGFNATVSGTEEKIANLKTYLLDKYGEIAFKDSTSVKKPFRRFKTKIREEIVTIEDPEIIPECYNNHLSPSDWNKVLENEDVILIDTRNDYENKLGMFKNAVDPKIKMFSEFTEFVEKQNYPKDKKVLMYCTGGIRCEKASIAMQKLGFENVYQLDGGILNYLAEYPNNQFEGECFVFDHRVAVYQNLKPSLTYGLCEHCGNPANAKEQIECQVCSKIGLVCIDCQKLDHGHTCSKNCANHYYLKKKKSA